MLKINNLTKKYGDKVAVNNLSLHIAPGEIYGFIGHNGAGKTTTLKSIAGILDYDSGEILIDGKSAKSEPLACKAVTAYIPDNPDIYDFMTGIQYLNFIADVFKVSESERTSRISEYAKMFEIEDSLNDLIGTYSHGMKQKLVIISALIHSPKLIMMDEPFVGLDPKATHQLKQIMRNICDNGGAIFFSTHVLEVAEKLCDKVAVIKGGNLVASGTVDEVKGNSSLEDAFLEMEE
ncbi:ABC transporter ATP-binding protein [uncultured Eubacterium sp.]|uniref:ABC transporter ATP-binding protein n=1 Tax=uncultured Eubacterium sp. TaxID=165185 RepID=UPI0025F500F6|nr:ABC transporter ATP-binding protein [uncultured Eubacterium sp.]